MPHLSAALDMLRDRAAESGASSSSTVGQGRLFERMVLAALRDHPGEYGPARFEDLWLWGDWPGRHDRLHTGDIGIDLVGQQTEAYGGGLCAVQCKFYDTGRVSTADVDKFLAASDGEEWTSRIFVATSDYTGPAAQKLDGARNTQILNRAKLDAWPLNWLDLAADPDRAEYDHIRYTPRPDQRAAVDAVADGLAAADRGRLLMPCGTGKSVVALWAAERLSGKAGRVLYLVPSIALMDQTMREWAGQRAMPHRYLGVCSDIKVGRRADDPDVSVSELAMPVTTDAAKIASELKVEAPEAMTTVFCTYQSLDKVALAQDPYGCPPFDLVICDEAHRTTGIHRTAGTDDEASLFQRIHDEHYLLARRRLYMTATQRVYTEAAKAKAKADGDDDVFSMEDEEQFGPLLYSMTFGEAIEQGLLSDYEVLVIGVGEDAYGDLLGPGARNGVEVTTPAGKTETVDYEDVVKLLGCWDALADPTTLGPGGEDRKVGEVTPGVRHCRRAIAFTNTVKSSAKAAAALTTLTGRAATDRASGGGVGATLRLDADHVDGKMNAYQRSTKLSRLRSTDAEPSSEPADRPRARVLSNARCLTEGVDVPALDAVAFLAPKRSDIDIVQAVGRVMRTAPGKTVGYVVLPVLVPEGKLMKSAEVLEGSDFKQVFRVLRALRSHDERLDVTVNSVNSALHKLPLRVLDRTHLYDGAEAVQQQLALDEVLAQKVASAVVEFVGDRQYWPSWGRRTADVCRLVRRHLDAEAADKPEVREALVGFARAMAETAIPSFTEADAREMIAQHVVTMPVFNAFFAENRFAKQNPVSRHIDSLLTRLAAAGVRFDRRIESLRGNYERITAGLSEASSEEKLDRLRQVYEGFFKAAIPDVVERLGIVYTPLPLVDFVLRSVDAVCRAEFGRGIGAEGVTVMDPFVGTGTFPARLFTLRRADGTPLVADADVARKYHSEVQAKDLVMLAYYIAALKIEESAAERGVFEESRYEPFPGIALADTFASGTPAMRSQRDRYAQQVMAVGAPVPENSDRARTQETTPIKVIVGNPPWSAGQKSSGDDNPRDDYEEIAQRVRETYGAKQAAVTGGSGGGKSAGNLYVQAFRWATDRLASPDGHPDNEGWIVAFVHPNSLVTATSLAGMRAALRDEFTGLYVVNLRGDAYKGGEEFKREGEKIFGSGSRNGVQITVLVRNPTLAAGNPAVLRYAEVPESLTRDQKFEWLETLGDVASDELTEVPVNERHDWVNIGDGSFDELLPVCDIDKKATRIAVRDHALGVATNCDTYVYSFSRDDLIDRVQRLIDAYEEARRAVHAELWSGPPDRKVIAERVDEWSDNDRIGEIKWTDMLKQSLRKGEIIEFDPDRIREVLYRPFTKLWLYEDHRILTAVKTVSAMFEDHGSRITDHGSRITDHGTRNTEHGTRNTELYSITHYHQLSEQQSNRRGSRDEHPRRPQLHRRQPTRPNHPEAAIMISGTSNMPFQALATAELPDLAAIKGSQQTRALPLTRTKI